MIRTVISLDRVDKKWLDEKSRAERVAMTELVRRAISRYRQSEKVAAAGGIRAALADTRGLWAGADALTHQRRMRDEWQER